MREQTVLTTALTELRKLLPFPLLGFDTDNDSVFMNETVQRLLPSRRNGAHALPTLLEK